MSIYRCEICEQPTDDPKIVDGDGVCCPPCAARFGKKKEAEEQ